MASDYWNSTQRQDWLFSIKELADIRHELDLREPSLVQNFPLPENRLLSIFFYQQLHKLIKRLNLRQPPLATAQVYVRRFYTKIPIRDTNPYLVLATALYVACKIEESPQNIRLVVAEARALWPEFISSDPASLGEMEFRLISLMGCELILHHPYRTLKYLEKTLQLANEELNLAWGSINDSFLTDLSLLHPPHVVAWAAAILALAKGAMTGQGAAGSSPKAVAEMLKSSLQGEKETSMQVAAISGQQARLHRLLEALADSEIDLTAVSEAMQEIISVYVLWESFREKEVKEQISRFVKSRGLER